uniref:Ig-like domain-containing protein n=1 Tax=Knipowitschia caucasica TaxID=637954 RepID=A0AAV2KN45_KNICA
MTPLLSLVLLDLFGLVSAALDPAAESLAPHRKNVYRAVTVGDNVTLECPHETQVFKYFWYEQSLGETPRLVASIYRGASTIVMDTRFTVSTDDSKNNLEMSNVQPSHSATYYCIMSYSMTFEFVRSVTVFVKGAQPDVQQPSHRDVKPGQTVVLNCTVQTGPCEGPRDVYWFKDHSDQCEPNVTSADRSCVYNLPLNNVSWEQTGTYYCAVAACGLVVFGGGTRLVIKAAPASVYFLSGALVFTCCLLFAGFPRLVQFMAAQQDDGQGRGKMDVSGTWSECIYLSVQ